jgi:hypothetical protein
MKNQIISINLNCINSIKKAEFKKRKLENNNFNLINTVIQGNLSILTYRKNESLQRN